MRNKTPIHPRAAAVAAGFMVSVAAACGGDVSTDPPVAPARLLSVSPATDTVLAGESADPPLSVRVENGFGEPVEGIPVRFLLLAEGLGTVEPMVVSDRQGIAEAAFRAGREAGEASVRADIPSAGHVAALEFRVVVVPTASVALAIAEGDGQEAEVASQLPLPFVVRATTPGGAPAGGVAIAWSLEGDPGSARLTADTAFTDEDGLARTLLTLGTEPGEHIVTAHATAGVVSDTARFRAAAAAVPTGSVRLDSVRPLPLVAGEEAEAFGSGFRSSAGANEVRVEGESAPVLTASPDRLHFTVPSFSERCLPARPVGIRVLAAGEASNGEMVSLSPREPALELEVGQAVTFGAGELDCLQLPGAAEPRAYWLAVQSASRSLGSEASLRLIARAGEDSGSGGAAALVSDPGIDPALEAVAEEERRPELELRANARRELARRRPAAPPAPAAAEVGADAAGGASPAVEPPAVGDTLEFIFAVAEDLSVSCTDNASAVRGVVRAGGGNVVLIEDTNAPPGGFGEAEWTALRDDLDRTVFPTDTAYFGSPADIDGNGRVLLLFTPAVNRLTPRGSATGIGGFFLPLDLAAARPGGAGVPGPGGETCPASNEGEILYLAVADPEGRDGDPLPVARALRNARGLTAHELQHLINAERRVLAGETGFDRAEEVWLDEGMSQLAEEVAGLGTLGMAARENLGFAPFAATRTALDAFNTFHIANFFHLSLFMLDPAGSATLAVDDPGGIAGLQMRGFAWAFLRWLGDQEGGTDERTLFRSLADGGPNGLRGIENIERVTGKAWRELLADFVATLPVDDTEGGSAAERQRLLTWNLRDVYEALSRNASSRRRFPLSFPLAFQRLPFESAAAAFRLGPSTARYFSLESATDTPPLALGIRSPGGGPPAQAGAPQVTIVRVR